MGRRRTPPPPKQPGDAWHVKLARLAEKRGKSGVAMARAADLSPAQLSRILKGESDTTVSALMAILDELDATLCDLHKA